MWYNAVMGNDDLCVVSTIRKPADSNNKSFAKCQFVSLALAWLVSHLTVADLATLKSKANFKRFLGTMRRQRQSSHYALSSHFHITWGLEIYLGSVLLWIASRGKYGNGQKSAWIIVQIWFKGHGALAGFPCTCTAVVVWKMWMDVASTKQSLF